VVLVFWRCVVSPWTLKRAPLIDFGPLLNLGSKCAKNFLTSGWFFWCLGHDQISHTVLALVFDISETRFRGCQEVSILKLMGVLLIC